MRSHNKNGLKIFGSWNKYVNRATYLLNVTFLHTNLIYFAFFVVLDINYTFHSHNLQIFTSLQIWHLLLKNIIMHIPIFCFTYEPFFTQSLIIRIIACFISKKKLLASIFCAQDLEWKHATTVNHSFVILLMYYIDAHFKKKTVCSLVS